MTTSADNEKETVAIIKTLGLALKENERILRRGKENELIKQQ